MQEKTYKLSPEVRKYKAETQAKWRAKKKQELERFNKKDKQSDDKT